MSDILSAAVTYLDAVQLPDGRYAYYAAETGRYYVVTAEDLASLGEALDDHDDRAAMYSEWCADTDSTEMLPGWEPDGMIDGSRLVLVRSDLGDGGWSLHAPVGDEQIARGEGLLACGPSECDDDGEWLRPDARDWERACDALRTSHLRPSVRAVIASRHAAAVEFIRHADSRFGAARVVEHATPDDVRGALVAGNIPMHLAALAQAVACVEMPDLPRDVRGHELTADEMRAYGARLSWYVVSTFERLAHSARELSMGGSPVSVDYLKTLLAPA